MYAVAELTNQFVEMSYSEAVQYYEEIRKRNDSLKNVVYRAMTPSEDPNDLKGYQGGISDVSYAIEFGSKDGRRSSYLHATRDITAALYFAEAYVFNSAQKIVAFIRPEYPPLTNLAMAEREPEWVLDLSSSQVQTSSLFKELSLRNYARKSSEVIIKGPVRPCFVLDVFPTKTLVIDKRECTISSFAQSLSIDVKKQMVDWQNLLITKLSQREFTFGKTEKITTPNERLITTGQKKNDSQIKGGLKKSVCGTVRTGRPAQLEQEVRKGREGERGEDDFREPGVIGGLQVDAQHQV
jgi:hypothetical protein